MRKYIVLCGVDTTSYIKSSDDQELLSYMTDLSNTFVDFLSLAAKNISGNTIILDLPIVTKTYFHDKVLDISLTRNYEIIKETIVSNRPPSYCNGTLFEYSETTLHGDTYHKKYFSLTEDARKKHTESMINQIIAADPEMAILTYEVALQVYNEILKSGLYEYILFIKDVDRDPLTMKHNVERWIHWYHYCRNMQYFDECFETFAGVKPVSMAFPEELKIRPKNIALYMEHGDIGYAPDWIKNDFMNVQGRTPHNPNQ